MFASIIVGAVGVYAGARFGVFGKPRVTITTEGLEDTINIRHGPLFDTLETNRIGVHYSVFDTRYFIRPLAEVTQRNADGVIIHIRNAFELTFLGTHIWPIGGPKKAN